MTTILLAFGAFLWMILCILIGGDRTSTMALGAAGYCALIGCAIDWLLCGGMKRAFGRALRRLADDLDPEPPVAFQRLPRCPAPPRDRLLIDWPASRLFGGVALTQPGKDDDA